MIFGGYKGYEGSAEALIRAKLDEEEGSLWQSF